MNKVKFLLIFLLPGWTQCYTSNTQQRNIQLCSICECFNKQIECFSERSIDFLNSEPNEVVFTINARHFRSVQKKLKWLRIDLSPLYNENLRISLDRQAFLLITNLEELILIKFTNLVELPNLVTSLKLKKLIVTRTSLNRIDPRFCDSKQDLVELNLSYNKLESLSHILDECKSLSVLDVSYNRIKSLDGVFGPNLELARIQLDKNELKELKQTDLANLEHVVELSLARNQIEKIEPMAFDKMKELMRLDLSMNKLKQLPAKSKVYFSLVYFNVDGNKDLLYFPAATQFKSLGELRVYYAYHCCPFLGRELNKDVKFEIEKVQEDNETFYEIEDFIIAKPFQEDDNIDEDKTLSSRVIITKCFPLPDAFMPCENLLETLLLRISVWLVSMAGLLANTSAIVYNLVYSWVFYSSTHELNVPTYLLTNLAFADSLMSIYLSFIAVKDMNSRDKFAQSALEWQRSRGCSVAGFLGMVSALASAFSLAFITFERYYAIKNSIDSNKRINGRAAVLASIVIWLVSIILASLPLAQLNLNSYESYALCLPFDTRFLGDRIYLGIVNSILSSCFLFILGCYLLIFTTTLIIERRASQPSGRDGDDTRLALNITLLVVVNLICWAPVVVLSARALLFSSSSSSSSHPIIDRAHLKLLAVFVLPFNSLANPLLYCIGRRRFRMDLITGWVNYRFRRNIRNKASVNSVRSVRSSGTTRTKNGSI